jgi:single stranded DNA-binding protein
MSTGIENTIQNLDIQRHVLAKGQELLYWYACMCHVSGEFVQRTEWHRICVFKPSLRDTVYTYLKKGQRVYVSGRLTYGEIKDEVGNPRTTTAVVADDVIFFQTSDS